MWSIQSGWFDVAVIMSIFAVGNILFGHFEEHKPKMRRLLKVVVLAGVTALLSSAGQRAIAYALIGALSVVAAYIHMWWLPRHGINGWTGEPREKYYALIGVARKQP